MASLNSAYSLLEKMLEMNLSHPSTYLTFALLHKKVNRWLYFFC